MSRRRCGSDVVVGVGVVVVVRTFLAVSLVFRGSDQALESSYFGGGTNSSHRAPSSCPPLPSHCNETLPPWACKPETRCSIKKPFCSAVGQNSSINAVNFTTNVFYYKNASNKCWQAVNLTWTARPKDYDGFFIRTIINNPARNVFNHNRTQKRLIIDKYKPGFGNGTEPMLFYYDCQRLGVASSYRFELYGLRNSRLSCLRQQLIGNITLATNCDTYPEADSRISKWAPYINVVHSDGNSTIKIYFTPAPRSFRFSSYRVLLLDLGTRKLVGNASGLSFTCTSFRAVVFKQVCSGNYSIQVLAFDESGQRCSDCGFEENVPVTGSNSSCLSDVLLESPSFENSTLPTLSSLTSRNATTSENSEKTKIMVGIIVLLALFIGTTVTVVTLSRICKGVNGVSGKKPCVLLIYARDNEYHCNVVQRFALYLQQRCNCEVKFDLWCPDEISEISALDWLLLHIKSAENIVVVNSEGGWRQYEGSARNVAFERVRSDTPLEDMFLPAMKELQSKRIFKVAFPYTPSRYFVGDAVHSGRTYVLMNDIEDLFLGIQQLSKHSIRGKKLAFDINASSYTKCKEGQSLAAAVKEASEFLHAKPGWFSEFYFQKNLSPEDCHPSPVFDSGFEPGADYGNGASDRYEMRFDDEAHGFTFYPPSDLDDNASSVSVSNIEELFAFVNDEYENTMTN